MPQNITGTAAYTAYPVAIPANGDKVNANTALKPVFQDLHNRIVYCKNGLDTLTTNLATTDGDVATLEGTVVLLQADVDALEISVNTLETYVDNVTYSGTTYIVTNDNHRLALQKIDIALKTVADQVTSMLSTVSGHTTTIASIGNKVSTSYNDGIPGFNFTTQHYLTSGNNAEQSLILLDAGVYANRRINNENFIQGLYNWRDIVGTGASDYHYDTLIDSSKIYYALTEPTSTPDAYDNAKQEFGINSAGWTFYSILKTVTAKDTIRIMRNYNTTYETHFYATFGGYEGSYVELVNQDQDYSLTEGTDLVIKVTGVANARLYNYKVLYSHS